MATILVIDDDLLLRRLMRRVLSAAGHMIVEADDGRQGMALAQKHQPVLVIVDIVMPEQEGIETIMEIRRSMPQTKILAVSGGGHDPDNAVDYLRMARRLGADRTLAKPFLPDELTALVAELLG